MADQFGSVSKSTSSGVSAGKHAGQQKRTAALLELAKAAKAISFYPAGHPQLNNALSQALGNIRPNLQAVGEMAFDVSRRGFSFQDVALGEAYPMVADLAKDMHLRQIKKFALRKNVTPAEFEAFLRLLAEDPDMFRSGRFIEQHFRIHQIRGIWVNEIDFGKAFSPAQAPQRTRPEPDFEPGEEELAKQVDELITMLDNERDPEKFQQIARELEVMAGQMLRDKKMKLAWYILTALSDLAEIKRDQSEVLAQHALKSVRALAREDIIIYLLEQYLSSPPEFRKPYHRFFRQADTKIVDPTIKILARNEALYSHRSLMELLVGLGPRLREPLEARLKDSREHVARKVCFILGERRERESVPALAALLGSQNVRIRKEAVRALSKIRAPEVSRLLIDRMRSKTDPETLAAVVQALGDIKDAAAATALISLAGKKKGDLELLETVVEVLGKIGSKQALPVLAKILNKKGLFNKERRTKLRLKAAQALGQIGGESAVAALTRNSTGGPEELNQACTSALESLAGRAAAERNA